MDALNELDEKMITEGVKNSKLWFKSELSRDVIKAFYTPCLKYGKDKDGNVTPYPPTIKLKLKKTNGEFDTKFYDVNGVQYKDVPVEELLQKGVQVTVIMECTGVWLSAKYGLSWKAKQIVIHELPKKMSDFAFKGLTSPSAVAAVSANSSALASASGAELKEDDEDEVDDEAVFAAKPSVLEAMMPQSVSQMSVDDEDGDDVEPISAPKKTIVKKKVVGKK
jgi:hypothetical protein